MHPSFKRNEMHLGSINLAAHTPSLVPDWPLNLFQEKITAVTQGPSTIWFSMT